ncbi:MAG: hypothetical protein ACI8Z1_003453, partial [Candidatus Azotimanducaceae bacterium]
MLRLITVLVLMISSYTFAADYPDMVGTWKAHLRTISSGSTETARGGAVISEADATVTIEHQDHEAFMGKVRMSVMTKNEPSIRLWGAIRSDGKEATYIGGDGSRVPIWILSET